MALVDPVETHAPLGQGDLLEGLTLYQTAVDSSPKRLDIGGRGISTGLVVSRNCTAVRQPHVLVAPVLPYRRASFAELSKPGVSLDAARRLMASLRDGWSEPDVFYLGTIPALGEERYAAGLQTICPVGLPSDDADRARWVMDRRIGRLSATHRRHLHTRLFRAFADEGFDDFSWWPTHDLRLIISIGRIALADLQSKLADARRNLETSRSDGQISPSHLSGALRGKASKVREAEAACERAEAELAPYLEELARRGEVE